MTDMSKNCVMTCIKLPKDLADRLSEVSRIMSITGQTKTSIVQVSLQRYIDRLEQDPTFQDLRKRTDKIRQLGFQDS